ncbi:YihY/virulence factor BrkB family protein [Aquincola sp. MAHUQ-54]|uniref:YihY/virulence factor BrkB family protein n=1 Tax=Aquincola agrisoli TaxID=3119538 RepID=A0AAW9QLL9_9BURK
MTPHAASPAAPAPLASRIVRLVRQSVDAWISDNASSMGAALAYYTLFSVAPLLLIVLTIVGLVFDQEAARGQIFDQLRGLMGPEGAAAVEALLESMNKPAAGVIGTLIGFVVLVIGATTVFAELQTDLDQIWRVPARQASTGVWALLRSRLLSFGMVLAIGFLLLVSLVVNAAISAWGSWTAPEGWEAAGQAVNFVISFGFTTAAFALIYKFMPRVHIHWRDVWVGAALTALLFTVGKLLIGLYIGKSGLVSGLGAASSIVVLLVWVYYSAQIFLMGAELTWVYAHEFGSRRGQEPAPRPDGLRGAAG